jgi:hypothetical protein
MRWKRVAAAVARQECDLPAADVGQEQRVRWGAIWGIDLDLAHVVEERVEARAAEDADLGRIRHMKPSIVHAPICPNALASMAG